MHAVLLKEMMTATVIAVPPHTPVAEVVDIMSERRISCVIITQGSEPVGIVTERDIVKRYDGLAGHGEIAISQVMTPAPVAVSADMDHFEAFKIMKERRIRHLVVRDDDDALCGVVTETDFIRHLGVEFYVQPKDVQSVMAPVVTAAEDAPLSDILAKLARPGIFCVVIERDGRACGILTERDAVRLLRQHQAASEVTAGSAMGQPLHTVAPTASLLDVSEQFSRFGIRHLVVVDEHGTARGVISEHEVVQGLESEYVGYLEGLVAAKDDALVALGLANQRLAVQSQALSSAVSDLEASHEELREFARVASHDLQEPSRLVVSFCQLLLKRHGDTLGDEGRELAEFAIEGALRMRRLVQDLAVYAAPAGAAGERVEAETVVHFLLEAMTEEVEAVRARVEVGPLPTVHIARHTLRDLFRHLIANALTYRHADVAPVIRIGADDWGDCWRFWVADNGIGIDPDYHDNSFRLFTRLHPPGPRTGTGAGLAICKRIVNAAGGRIWVESASCEGSTFYFTLPK